MPAMADLTVGHSNGFENTEPSRPMVSRTPETNVLPKSEPLSAPVFSPDALSSSVFFSPVLVAFVSACCAFVRLFAAVVCRSFASASSRVATVTRRSAASSCLAVWVLAFSSSRASWARLSRYWWSSTDWSAFFLAVALLATVLEPLVLVLAPTPVPSVVVDAAVEVPGEVVAVEADPISFFASSILAA